MPDPPLIYGPRGRLPRLRENEGAIEKFCPHCHEWKVITSFGRKKGRVRGEPPLAAWCKSCCVRAQAEFRQVKGRWVSPLVGRIQRIISNMVHQGSLLRSSDIHRLYEVQRGRCYYTGVMMRLMSPRKSDPLLMSVDRVDSARGYEEGNVVLCCLAVNHLKGRHGVDEMYENLERLSRGARRHKKEVLRGWD